MRTSWEPVFIGSALRQKRAAVPMLIALGVILLFATAQIVSTVSHLSRTNADVPLIFLGALVVSSVFALVPVGILWFLDRRERERPWLFAIAFAWGGLIATGLSLPLNNAILGAVDAWVKARPEVTVFLGPRATLLIGAPIAGPLVEETMKALGVLLLLFLMRGEFDGVRDGFIYGALVGAGFNWLESAVYVSQGFAQYGYAPTGLQMGGRYALFGLSGHALYTGIFGAFVGWGLQSSKRWWRYVAPVAGWLLAVLAHMINNVLGLLVTAAMSAAGKPPPAVEPAPPVITLWQGWLQKSVLDLVLFLPFLVLMGILIWRSGRWERKVIADELAGEKPSVVTPDEYAQIVSDRMLRTRRISRRNPPLSRAIVNAQNELAFRKHRVKLAGENPDADPLVQSWRAEIELLRPEKASVTDHVSGIT